MKPGRRRCRRSASSTIRTRDARAHDFDLTHPYRQTEVVRTVNERVGRKLVSGYDLQCVRKVYDAAHRPEFFHRPKFGSPQYSEAFVSWLVSEWEKDEFFEKAKAIIHPPRVEDTEP